MLRIRSVLSKWWDDDNIRNRSLVEQALIVILPIILFWRYLSGHTAFVFNDIADDSFHQYYPGLLHLADRLQAGQWTDAFSFAVGLGNKESSIIPWFDNWPAFFGRENVAYLMGVNAFLKMALSGLLIYGLATLWQLKDEKRLIIALGYEFNVMFTVRSAWRSYSGIAFMTALWLFGFEYAYRKKNLKSYLFLGLVSELFFINLDIYYCVFYGVLLGIYIICRVLSDGRSLAESLRLSLINFGLFAALGMADTFIPKFLLTISSERVSDSSGKIIGDLGEYLKIDWSILPDAFIRTIGQDIEGINPGEFRGYFNLLSGPSFYIGILMFILVPVALYNVPRVKRMLFLIGYLMIGLYISVPFVRWIASGFAGASFKYASFGICLLIMITVIEGFYSISNHGYKDGSLFVFNATSVIAIICMVLVLFTDRIARFDRWLCSLIYIIVYMILGNLIILRKDYLSRLIFALVLLTEGLVLSYNIINERITLSQQELDNFIFNPVYTAVHSIDEPEESWYRIERYPSAITLCDPLGKDYYGTTSYVGGIGISQSVKKYYKMLNLPYDDRRMYGSAGNIYAGSLLGVKYDVVDTQDCTAYGVSYCQSCDNVHVFKNDLALPLGYCYDQEINPQEFASLSYYDRNKALLRAALVDDGSLITNIKPAEAIMEGIPIKKEVTAEDNVIDVSVADGDLLVVIPDYKEDINEEDGPGMVCWADATRDMNYLYFSRTGIIELNSNNISKIWFDNETVAKLSSVSVYSYDADTYYDETLKNVEKLKKSGYDPKIISDYEMVGSVNTANDGIFATSIPFDDNWQLFIDDEEKDLFRVNTGFVGSRITKGHHDIRLYYRHDSWIESNKLKCLGLFLLFVAYIIIIVNENRALTCALEVKK